MLVNQMRSGSLDAAVAYLSNAAGAADFLHAIRTESSKEKFTSEGFRWLEGERGVHE